MGWEVLEMVGRGLKMGGWDGDGGVGCMGVWAVGIGWDGKWGTERVCRLEVSGEKRFREQRRKRWQELLWILRLGIE